MLSKSNDDFVIIFEGCDRAGKSTLLGMANKATNFKYWVLDRSPISSLVYDSVYCRGNAKYIQKTLKSLRMNFNILVVYIYADEDKILDRAYKTGEIIPLELSNFKDLDDRFRKAILDFKAIKSDKWFEAIFVENNESIEEAFAQVIKKIYSVSLLGGKSV